MINKKSKRKTEKTISIFEIFILITSVLTFAYFIGDEFKFVEARPFLIPRINDAWGISSATIPTPAVTQVATFSSITTVPTTYGGDIIQVIPEIATKVNPFSKFIDNMEFNLGNMALNAVIAIGLYAGTYYLLTGVFGQDEVAAAEAALLISAGYGAGVFVSSIFGWGGSFGIATPLGIIPGVGIIGAVIGITWWIFFGTKDQETWTVQYTCNPWQPQTGGENCNKCNIGDLPCTKYKCLSLGASCEIVNEDTSEEACYWKDRNDVTPPTISAWKEALGEDYEYVDYPATYPNEEGVIIKYTKSEDGCAPAFSRITYGISLDKLGKCKIDSVRKTNFSEMTQIVNFGRSRHNHTLTSLHGGITELRNELKEGLESGAIKLINDGEYEIFVRCESTNGAANKGTFVFKYCVQKQPDTTAPSIKLTDPFNKWPIETGKTSQDVTIYTDKPADCRWSHNNENYDDMAETMTCDKSILDINPNGYYKCDTTLTGLKDNVENKFYFNCKSYPSNEEADRYTMAKNYPYSLMGTRPLVIDSISPVEGTLIKDSTESVQVILTAETSAGYNKGNAWCSFKTTEDTSDRNYVLFSNTNSYRHSQSLWLDKGNYKYSIKCCDIAELVGNCDEEHTYFDVETDFASPKIIRVYNENIQLKIVTNEGAECVYGTNSCSYNFNDGIRLTTTNSKEHFIDWDTDNNFYIKCKDEFGNEPKPDLCSIIARPFSSY